MTLNRLTKLMKPYRGAGVLFTAADTSGTNRVLLGKRLYHPYADHWAIPGGQMDEQDRGDFRLCAAREAFEETIALSGGEQHQHLLVQQLEQSRMHRVHVPFAFDFRIFRVQLDTMPNIRLWPRLDHWGSEFAAFAWFEPAALPTKMHPFLGTTIQTLTRAR